MTRLKVTHGAGVVGWAVGPQGQGCSHWAPGPGALSASAPSRLDSLHQTRSSEKVVFRLVKQQFEGLCPVISIFWCLIHFCPPSVGAVPGTP